MPAFSDILRIAIRREMDSYALYTQTAEMVESSSGKELLHDLAKQEALHREKLEQLLETGSVDLDSNAEKRVVDLKITDYLVEPQLERGSDFQQILIVAAKREKAAYDLYLAMGQVTEDSQIRSLFEFLAGQELEHKQRLEIFYDDIVLREN